MAWDRIAAAVTHRRSWAIALLIAAGASVFMALIGSNTGADKAPLQLPPTAESARAAALLKSFPGGDQLPAILVVSRRDGSALTPDDLGAADSTWQRVRSTTGGARLPHLVMSQDGRAAVAPIPIAAGPSRFSLHAPITPPRDPPAARTPAGPVGAVNRGPAFH